MKRDYLSSLTRAARWYLSPAEATEVLEDYQEIVEGRPEEELRRDLGTPRTVARQLAQPREYRRWLAVFVVLTVCIGRPAATIFLAELFNAFGWYWNLGQNLFSFTWVFFGVGMVLALVWFRRNGKTETSKTLFRCVLPRLALILVGMAWVWFIVWLVLGEHWELLGALFPGEGRVPVLYLSIGVDGFAMGLMGLAGLIRARLGDRRWLAVYALGLAGVILVLSFWGLMTSLNFNGFVPGWQIPFIARYAFITLAGLIGTAVALC